LEPPQRLNLFSRVQNDLNFIYKIGNTLVVRKTESYLNEVKIDESGKEVLMSEAN